jgi:hypothetical protein
MKQPAKVKRFPAWLRFVGWVAFSGLALATVLIVARWWVFRTGHQRTLELVKQGRRFADVSKSHVAVVKTPEVTSAKPTVANGMPLSSLPYFGEVLTGDEEGWAEFKNTLQEIHDFLNYRGIHRERIDGVLSFRAVLQNKGVNVPDTMTEAEAAAEFLKQTDRFSSLLAQWREVVGKGPLSTHGPADYQSNPSIYRFNSMANSVERILRLTAEAHIAAGDSAAAWQDWQTMKDGTDRISELFPAKSYEVIYGKHRLLASTKVGLLAGAWTDENLATIDSVVARENALATAQTEQEMEKDRWTDYYTNFREHEDQFRKDFLKTPSLVNRAVNQIKLELITEQQIQDNMNLKLFEIDQELSRFDPETGFYVQPTEEELMAAAESKRSVDPLGSFYFMIGNSNDRGDDQWAARRVIETQSELDQFRLAAALETYQHRTGQYPDRLDAVSSQFPDGAPRDIATGQPYLYQREPDGGYKLWGTGIDGKSEGGDAKTDVIWIKRPMKSQ